MELQLTFRGDVAPADEPDSVHVPDDGKVRVIGTVTGPVNDPEDHTPGTLITSGGLQFAIEGDPPADRVRCTGELWEDRHGWPAGTTTGRLVDIRWRPARLTKVSDIGHTIDGYGPGQKLNSTEQRHGHSDSWAFMLTVWVNVT